MASRRAFEWDEAKATANLRKHGLPFEEAVGVFLDPELVDFDASHAADGERRRKAVGALAGRLFTVVYTVRGGRIRLISARRANAQEGRHYGNG